MNVNLSAVVFVATLLTVGCAHAQQQQPKSAQTPEQRAPSKSVEALQATLVELIALGRDVQQAHWNLEGPAFFALHEMYGEFYAKLQAQIDEVAERARAVRGVPDGRVTTVAQSANLPQFPAGLLEDRRTLSLLQERYETVTKRVESRMVAVGEQDLGTQDRLIEVQGLLQKQLWMIRSHLAK